MSIYIIIVLLVIISIGSGIWFFQKYYNTDGEINKDMTETVKNLQNKPHASKIIVSLKDNTPVGFIEVKDNKLNFVINNGNDNLKIYLDAHKAEWEGKTFNLEIGGKTKSGAMWDGMVAVKIGDDMYITALLYDDKGLDQFRIDNKDKYKFNLE